MSKEGFLLINKPPGKSSFDMVQAVRRLSQIKKVGHAGTLDPFASGLLVLALGKSFTKQISLFQNLDKEYTVRFCLGITTDTLDCYGAITQKDSFSISKEDLSQQLKEIIPSFLGDIEQIPPIYSAKKVKGKPLYKYAREGKDVEIKPTSISIRSLKITDITVGSVPLISMTVQCSKGTYIRTLVSDIAKSLGTIAYAKDIIRSKIGPHCVSNSLLFNALSKEVIHQNLFDLASTSLSTSS
tara:strand:+ start:1043 stop:1765 length:723 start_codon:yes stop_codon:yes gene_type:complete